MTSEGLAVGFSVGKSVGVALGLFDGLLLDDTGLAVGVSEGT